ncbi:MAG: LemA family protein [Planctomycetota bacterium]|jgi:LemA protein|nr:LemA family protein [Planctomycetota bacterium]
MTAFLFASLALYIPIGVVVLTILILVVVYNGLVSGRNETENAWSQVDVQLKRRYDLIPNLVETAKGYMEHEKETLEAVIKARQQAISVADGSVVDQAKAENFLSQTLRSLFAVTESYPDLKANQNMLALQEELTSTENRIGFARQHFNDAVLRYNNRVQQFPGVMVAGMFGFSEGEFFELQDEGQREPVQVKF